MRTSVRTLVLPAALLAVAAPLFAGFAGTDVFLPSVGRRPGNFGSQYYTALWIHNPSASTANVTISFLLRNQPNPSPAVYYDSIPPGDSRDYPDTITTLFSTQAWGALRITSNVRVIALCRMYNLPSGGQDKDTQGQGYNAIPAGFAIGSGQSTKLLGVSQTNPKADSQFRYSFGWVEAAGGTADVQVAAFDETGTQVASKTYPTTGAYEPRYYAIEDLYPAVNSSNLTLQVSVVSGSGKVIAVGSGTANTSNDSTTFEMQFADSLLGSGSGGLSAVSHDASLTGDGTSASPLGIASGQVVRSLNGLHDDVTLAAGSNVTITPSGHTLTIASSASGGGLTLPYSGSASSSGVTFEVLNNGTGWAIHGSSPNLGVLGSGTGTGTGVKGESSGGNGVYGTSTGTGYGVRGDSTNGSGVFGFSTNGYGVLGSGSSGQGVHGESNTGPGVYGKSNSGYGVEGETSSSVAVYGISNSADGVVGQSTSRRGVHGTSSSSFGVLGESSSSAGVDGVSDSSDGVRGESSSGEGVHGKSDSQDGVFGEASAANKSGIYGVNANASGYAGYFNGNVKVNGAFSVTGAKSFAIDHPLDPANRELWHAAVESDEVLNVYSGNVTTDTEGRAVVRLPDWFEALNTDFRYQLTVIGRFAQAIVEEEITGNAFVIRTNLSGVKVSWQVTARRNDAWMRAHPFAVERDKPVNERGTYLSPREHGQPEESGVEWVRRPELIRRMKEQREAHGGDR